MSEGSLGNNVTAGVVSGVATALILAVISWVAGSVWNNYQGPPVAVVVTQVPVSFDWDGPSPYYVKEVIEAVQGAKYPPAQDSRAGFSERRRGELLDENKENIVKQMDFFSAQPSALNVVKLTNTTSKVVKNVTITATSAIKTVGPAGETVGADNPFTTKIDPNESKTFYIWSKGYVGYSAPIKVLAGDEFVPVTVTPNEPPSFASFLLGQGWIGLVLALIFLVGLVGLLVTPIVGLTLRNDNLRRKGIKSEEFDRMLGDVKALFPKFRPNEPNPFQ